MAAFRRPRDLAPFLQVERIRLIKESHFLKNEPDNYKSRLRDTLFKVWLEKNNSKDWKTLQGTHNTKM